MKNVAHIFVRRSTKEQGDGSLIAPTNSARVSFLYDFFIESVVLKRIREYENSLSKEKGRDYVDDKLKKGIQLIIPIKGVFVRFLGRILGLGNQISVLSLKVKPDNETNDPRARNSEFIMCVVIYCQINFQSSAFRRFAEKCRHIAFGKKSPGEYNDFVIWIPDDVFGSQVKEGL